MCMGLINEYQKNTFSLAPISALLAKWTIYHSCITFLFTFLGYSELCGRSSHCVSQPGLQQNTFLNCDNILQEGLLGIVLQCWWKLTCFTLQGELMQWICFRFPLKDRICQLCCCFLLPAQIFVPSTPIGMSIFHWPLLWPQFIISIESIFPRHFDLLWRTSDFVDRAVICAWTTPDPWSSRISRWAYGQFRHSNWHDFNRIPGARAYIDWQWCVIREVSMVAWCCAGSRKLCFGLHSKSCCDIY
jgi:hypothetical protein